MGDRSGEDGGQHGLGIVRDFLPGKLGCFWDRDLRQGPRPLTSLGEARAHHTSEAVQR